MINAHTLAYVTHRDRRGGRAEAWDGVEDDPAEEEGLGAGLDALEHEIEVLFVIYCFVCRVVLNIMNEGGQASPPIRVYECKKNVRRTSR